MEPYEVSLFPDLENQLQKTVWELSLETVPSVSVCTPALHSGPTRLIHLSFFAHFAFGLIA